MKIKNTLLAIAGGAAVVGSLAVASISANASTEGNEAPIAQEWTGSYTTPEPVEVTVWTSAQIESFADCVTDAGFEMTVTEGNGIMGSVADAFTEGYDEAINSCSVE